MKPSDTIILPTGWEIKKLKEVANYFIGLTYSPKDVSDNGIIVLRSSNVQNGKLDFNDIIRVNRQVKDGLKVKDGDILMCSRNGSKRLVGKIATIQGLEEEMTFGTFMTVIRSQYNPYLSWFFISDEFREQIGGGENPMINQITKYMLDDIEIPLPPLPEQQCIVSILDEAFDAIATAKANAEQNLKNARELFESYLQGVFENKGEGWEEKRFDEICVLQRGFDLPTHSRNEGQYPLVSSNGITDRIDLWKVKAPGVVTGRSGTIGNVHFIEEDFWPLNTALYIKEFHGNYERFIYYFLKQFDLSKYSSGAGVPTLNRNNVHSEMVWFPKSIIEQQTIIAKLDALSSETKRLEAIYQQKIADLEELKKSVLQKAFNGELKTGIQEKV